MKIPNIELPEIKDVISIDKIYGTMNLYELLHKCANDELVYVFNDTVELKYNYVANTNFNYMDKVISIPLVGYESKVYNNKSIVYNITYDIKELFKNNGGCSVLLFSPVYKKYYKLDFNMYKDALFPGVFRIDELLHKYAKMVLPIEQIKSSLVYIDTDDEIQSVGRDALKVRLFKTKFIDHVYNDFRYFRKSEINAELLSSIGPVVDWRGRFDFESMLFFIFYVDAKPDNEVYLEMFNQLGSKLRFIKIPYKNSGIGLILKAYYKHNSKFKSKSYEIAATKR